MPRPLQSFVAVALGAALGGATAVVGERAGNVVEISQAMARHEASGPIAPGTSPTVLLEWVAWLAGSLVGGWVAARLAPTARTHHALATAALLGARGLAALSAGAHSAWLWPLGFLVWFSAAWLGAWLARPHPA